MRRWELPQCESCRFYECCISLDTLRTPISWDEFGAISEYREGCAHYVREIEPIRIRNITEISADDGHPGTFTLTFRTDDDDQTSELLDVLKMNPRIEMELEFGRTDIDGNDK